MSDSTCNVVVIYEHRDKFIAKCQDEFCHIKKNSFTANLELKKTYSITGSKVRETIKDKLTNVFELTKVPERIFNTSESLDVEPNKINNEFEKLKIDFLEDPLNYTKFAALKSLSKQSSEYKTLFEVMLSQNPQLIIRFNSEDDQEEKPRFLILASEKTKYREGEFVHKFNSSVKVLHTGKIFTFRNRSNKKSKLNFKDGDQVCYVYYSINEPNWLATDFMLAMKSYVKIVKLIKKNGVKPRHKPDLIAKLKELPVVCDGRNRIMGHSWIAVGEEDLWYCTHILSSVDIENNIKINGKFAQCWRVSKRHIREYIDSLYAIDAILFKSNAFPLFDEEKPIIQG